MSKKQPIPTEVVDASQERFNRVKPVVEDILKKILDQKLLFADLPYLQQEVTRHLEVVVKNIVIDMTNDMFKLINDSLKIAYELAEKKLWEVADLDDVSVDKVEDVLKKK